MAISQNFSKFIANGSCRSSTKQKNCSDKYSGVRFSFYTYYISPIDIGLLRTKIKYLKILSMALIFLPQTDMYVIDLLNEILNIYFGQGAPKISDVKVGGR